MHNYQISARNLLILKKYLALIDKAEYEKRCIAKRKMGMSWVTTSMLYANILNNPAN